MAPSRLQHDAGTIRATLDRTSLLAVVLLAALATAAGCGLDWDVPSGYPRAGGEGGASPSSSPSSGESSTSTTSSTTSTAGGSADSASSSSASSSSTSASSSSSSAASSSSSGMPSACDDRRSCNECELCAQLDRCAGPLADCENEPECTSYDACIDACANPECVVECANDFPLGASLFYLYAECIVCDACTVTCLGYYRCN